MAPFLFKKKTIAGEPIDVFNHGHRRRDFTYIDDVVEAIIRLLDRPATADPAWSSDKPDPAGSNAPYRLYDIGNHTPVSLLEFIATIEQMVGKKAKMNLLPAQPGDVEATSADVSELERAIGFAPKTPLDEGIRRFVAWYRDFYRI